MLRHLTDTSVGDWIAQRRGPFGAEVGSTVPQGMAAYARILHPAGAHGDGTAGTRWAEVATATGHRLRPTTAWWRLAGRPDVHATAPSGAAGEWPGTDPEVGSLPPAQLSALVDILRPHAAGRVVVGWWDGWGEWSGGTRVTLWWDEATGAHGSSTEPGTPSLPAEVRDGPRLSLPGRRFVLFEGTLDDVLDLARGVPRADVAPFAPGRLSPNLWWAQDETWCVASEIDFDSTLVAGSRALVDAVLASGDLEALEVAESDSLGLDA